MITVISSTGDSVNDLFDKRFGRAGYFCVFNEETKETKFVKNIYKEEASGAGVKTSEMVMELNAEKVISGHFGPKAKEILDRFKVQLVVIQESMKIEDIINKLSNK